MTASQGSRPFLIRFAAKRTCWPKTSHRRGQAFPTVPLAKMGSPVAVDERVLLQPYDIAHIDEAQPREPVLPTNSLSIVSAWISPAGRIERTFSISAMRWNLRELPFPVDFGSTRQANGSPTFPTITLTTRMLMWVLPNCQLCRPLPEPAPSDTSESSPARAARPPRDAGRSVRRNVGNGDRPKRCPRRCRDVWRARPARRPLGDHRENEHQETGHARLGRSRWGLKCPRSSSILSGTAWVLSAFCFIINSLRPKPSFVKRS